MRNAIMTCSELVCFFELFSSLCLYSCQLFYVDSVQGGRSSDYQGAADLLDYLSKAKYFQADRGDGFNGFRQASHYQGITLCRQPKRNLKEQISYDKNQYKLWHKIAIMFGRLNDCRRSAMSYNRYAHTFFFAIWIAVCVTFCVN